jgi:hypothetical protein
MKKQQTRQGETKVSRLKLSRETLRQLNQAQLQNAGGGISGTSICTETTHQCCVTL